MKCNYVWDLSTDASSGANYYDLGDLLMCILGNTWGVIQIFLFGVTIILVARLVLKSIQSRDEPKAIAEIQKNWIYLMLLILVVIGGAGTILNILLPFFKIPGVEHWLNTINTLFSRL